MVMRLIAARLFTPGASRIASRRNLICPLRRLNAKVLRLLIYLKALTRSKMMDSVWFGIGLAVFMLFLMFLPTFAFKPPDRQTQQKILRDYIDAEIQKED
jgi:hypothetical protein